MNQLSRPYQFALIGVLVFGVLWLAVLRPSDGAEDVDAPLPAAPAAQTAPGVKGLSTAVDKANGAVAQSEQSAAATKDAAAQASGEAARPKATATPAPATPAATPATQAAVEPVAEAKPKTTAGDPSRPILDALGKGKVAVVLFYEGKAADDRAVRRAVRELPRRGGKVKVYSAPIKNVGRYDAITRGVQVLSAPTVLVIGGDRAVNAIVGFTQVGEIDQLVGDALRRARAASAAGAPAVPGSA